MKFAGVEVDNVTLKEATDKLDQFVFASKPHLIVTPNPEIIVAAQKDQELLSVLNSADLKVPDGISMVVVSKILGCPLKERVSGIDLMQNLLERASVKGYKVFLMGGSEGVAVKAAKNIRSKFPEIKIVGTLSGYFSNDSEIIKKIKAAQPDLLFVGLGMGKQEKWLHHNLASLDVSVAMAIGGSLDVLSGLKKRAPKIFQKLYIEWLYRLFSEPSRWRRQLALPKFLWLAFFS